MFDFYGIDELRGKLVISCDKSDLGITLCSYESFLIPHSIRVCVFFPDFTYRWYDEHELIYLEKERA